MGGAILFGSACSLLYLVLHWSVDKFRAGRSSVPPVRRSMDKVPESVVPVSDRAAQLRTVRALIDSLADSTGLWAEAQAEAETWLADYDTPNADEPQLLKRAYLLLFAAETGHKVVPSLSKEHAREVSDWLTEYLGKEERA